MPQAGPPKSPPKGQPKRPLPCPALSWPALPFPSCPPHCLSCPSVVLVALELLRHTPIHLPDLSHLIHPSSSTPPLNHTSSTTRSILPTLFRIYILIDKTRTVLRLKHPHSPTDLHALSRTPQHQSAHLSHAVLNSRRHCLCHCQTRVARPLSTAYLNTGFTHLTAHLSQPLRQHIRTATYHTPHSFTQPSIVRPHSPNFESPRLPVRARLSRLILDSSNFHDLCSIIVTSRPVPRARLYVRSPSATVASVLDLHFCTTEA